MITYLYYKYSSSEYITKKTGASKYQDLYARYPNTDWNALTYPPFSTDYYTIFHYEIIKEYKTKEELLVDFPELI